MPSYLLLGDGLEDGELLGLLEAAEAGRVGAGLGRDHDHGRVGPEGGGHAGDKVGDPGAVLGHADASLARDASIAVGHVRRVLWQVRGTIQCIFVIFHSLRGKHGRS